MTRYLLRETGDFMNLEELDAKWREYLAAESCPAVLGLAPLSEDESEVIRELVADELARSSRAPWQALFALLPRFPACLVVWLARKAGEAYEEGAFWEKFSSAIGASIPLNQRAEFAKRFRDTCHKTMAAWLPPQELGGHNIVAEFLYQAGLPLDRCDGFAQHVRKVERSLGLPDAEAPDAGEQLCEAVLDSLRAIPVPTLKRALRGPAGSRICEVALSVVLNGEFADINPRLGKELARVFEEAGHGSLRRSAHQPFLRLGEDLGSLEIVGPRQDASLIGLNGLTWVVDDRRCPTPRTEEFVLTITDQRRVSLELTGLVLGAMPSYTFVLRLNDLAEPFILFDEKTRRQRRVGGPVPSGYYWLLHRRDDTLVGADQCYEWPDGERSLSFFRALPGIGVTLQSDRGGPWRFAAALTPFFDATGERITDESGQTICFGWVQMPFVWLPIEETDTERLVQWHVRLTNRSSDCTWALSSTGDEAGGMAHCLIEADGYLATLSAGLHRLEFSLQRGERGRDEAQAGYWYWQGLASHDPRGFRLSGQAVNLIRHECRGFAFEVSTISHLVDQYRRHTLAFGIDGSQIAFHWAQPGIFVESFERRPGKQAVPHSHLLGEAFPASLNSARWIRIWLAGQREWQIVVGEMVWHRDITDDRREFVELSLAGLATAFPGGGDIRLRLRGSERLLARFSSPIHPLSVVAEDDESHAGFRFHFSERILWARPVVNELASGQHRILAAQRFGPSGRCVFSGNDLPPIECSNVEDRNRDVAFGHPVTLRVPKQGWPEGLWLIELEVRRDENADEQPVTLRGHDHAPIVISVHNGGSESTTRSCLLWASFDSRTQFPDFTLDDSGRAELFELLVDLIGLRQRGIDAAAIRRMGWLKDAVRALSQLVGRIARQRQSNELQSKLLNLACQDASHLGFVYLPGLLALPSSEYRELPSGDPLNDALRRCGKLAVADSVADAVRADFSFLDINVIGCFENFPQVADTPIDEPLSIEFSHFAHERYWERVLGTAQVDRLVPDWSGESASGREHMLWALAQLVRRYENETHHLNLAAANALLHCALEFRAWLNHRLGTKALMSTAAWTAPWPRFAAPDVDFLEAVPRFASLFALAARSAAADLLEFDEALTWLESHVERRWMAEEGIAVLVSLAPELFGHQLLFWELIVRTTPH
jgi:hypothetical protein